MSSSKIDASALAQGWLHAHEEDTGDTMVFRPSSFKLGPSRGRAGFELKPDGGFVESRIAATDESLKQAREMEAFRYRQTLFLSRGSGQAGEGAGNRIGV